MNHIFKYTISVLACICIIFLRCTKEYSVEGLNVPPILIDTIKPPVTAYVCPYCPGNETFIENKWSLRDDTLLRCGIVDTAIVNPQRTGFTFYGPSACSADTGIVMTIILDTVLNRDLADIRSRYAAFYYYDNVGQTYIYMSTQQNPFTVIIDSYDHQTRLASGTFSGLAFRTTVGGTFIKSGKFKTKLM